MNDDKNILPMKNGLSRTKQQTDMLIAEVKKSAGIIQHRRIKMWQTFIVAIAVFAVGVIGVRRVSAYISYYHKHSVDKYANNPASVEIEFEYDVMSAENAHFRVTIDRILCDGENAMMIITVDSLDGTSIHDAHPVISYSIGEQPYTTWSGGYAYYDGQEEIDGKTYSCVQYLNLYDASGYYFSRFTIRFSQSGYNSLYNEVENMYEGISFDVLFEKNVKTADLYDSEGNQLLLSQFGIYSNEISVYPLEGMIGNAEESVYYILNDGSKKHIPDEQIGGSWGSSGTLLIFSEIIDINDYKGIEINGVEYLKK